MIIVLIATIPAQKRRVPGTVARYLSLPVNGETRSPSPRCHGLANDPPREQAKRYRRRNTREADIGEMRQPSEHRGNDRGPAFEYHVVEAVDPAAISRFAVQLDRAIYGNVIRRKHETQEHGEREDDASGRAVTDQRDRRPRERGDDRGTLPPTTPQRHQHPGGQRTYIQSGAPNRACSTAAATAFNGRRHEFIG